jgi:hypothetical protein
MELIILAVLAAAAAAQVEQTFHAEEGTGDEFYVDMLFGTEPSLNNAGDLRCEVTLPNIEGVITVQAGDSMLQLPENPPTIVNTDSRYKNII